MSSTHKTHKKKKKARQTNKPGKPELTGEQKIDAALLKSARIVAQRLAGHPREPRARYLGDLLAELCADLPGAPPLARRAVALRSAADRRTAGSIMLGMWREITANGALDDARAHALARRIADTVDAAAVLFIIANEAREHEHEAAATVLMDRLASHHAAFLAGAPALRIDRPLLESLGLPIAKAQVKWHDDGHLASLSAGGRVLQLDAVPGSGSYREEGRRGGYGFAIDERYRAGHAHGTFCSPWHDGEEYATKQPWLSWVSACAATVLT
jgi:hypothetical protein